MKLLLHACCGPCLVEPGRILSDEFGSADIYFYNPNIHPQDEYDRRLDTCSAYSRDSGWAFIEDDYDPERWEETAGIFGEDRQKRCRVCYRLRFTRLADVAAERGYDAISTTLSVSPYQDQRTIQEELERAAQGRGLAALYRDFSGAYARATQISREKGMYRQNYCGCRFSDAEAEEERRMRKEERRRKRELRAEGISPRSTEGTSA